nr:MAG TPA: hypothetical protein [Bacteriophage sp.]
MDTGSTPVCSIGRVLIYQGSFTFSNQKVIKGVIKTLVL